MRRAEREVTDIDEIQGILDRAQVCRLALMDDEFPYIIPMCFGYDLTEDKLVLYFHCAGKGKKLDLIKANSNAAFEVDSLNEIISGDIACSFSALYESITGIGTVEVINGIEKITGLNRIMSKYSGSPEFKYSEGMLNNVVILRLTADSFCCKANRGAEH